MTDNPLLSVRGLKKHYPITEEVLNRDTERVRAVDGVDFDVHRGETPISTRRSSMRRSVRIFRRSSMVANETTADVDLLSSVVRAAASASSRACSNDSTMTWSVSGWGTVTWIAVFSVLVGTQPFDCLLLELFLLIVDLADLRKNLAEFVFAGVNTMKLLCGG